MNAALTSMLMRFLSDKDAKKDKEEDRRYMEQQREKELGLRENKETVDRMRADRLEREAAIYREKNPIEFSTDEEFKKTGNVLRRPLNQQDFLYNPTQAQTAQTHEMRIKSMPLEEGQRYRTALVQAQDGLATARKHFPADWTDGQIAQAVGNDFSKDNVLKAVSSLKALDAGVPDKTVRSTISGLDATDAAQRLQKTRDEAALPLAADVVTSGQRRSLTEDMLGGMSVAQAYDKPYYPRVTGIGDYTIEENPFAERINEDPLERLLNQNQGIKAAAEQLNLPKYPMEVRGGVPVRRTRPALATDGVKEAQGPAAFGAGIVYPGPERQPVAVPRGYEQFADRINMQLPGTERAPVSQQAVKNDKFKEMVAQYLKRKQAQEQGSRLVFPQ